MAFGLSEHTINKLVNIFDGNNQVEEAILFGSRAKGNYREGSDIDITLKGKNLTLKTIKTIEVQIDNLFLPYEVNLVLFNYITNPLLIEHIERVGISIYNAKVAKG